MLVVGVGLSYKGVMHLRKHGEFGDRSGWALIGTIGGGILAALGILIVSITLGGRAYNRIECRNWGHQTNRPTKYVTYTSWSTGECLTPDNNGKWISKDQVRQFSDGN
jgi:hypothetical protein